MYAITVVHNPAKRANQGGYQKASKFSLTCFGSLVVYWISQPIFDYLSVSFRCWFYVSEISGMWWEALVTFFHLQYLHQKIFYRASILVVVRSIISYIASFWMLWFVSVAFVHVLSLATFWFIAYCLVIFFYCRFLSHIVVVRRLSNKVNP